MSATISLCMIAKNEAGIIGEAIESVKGIVDEIIVVDTGSSDTTVALATSYGAKIFSFQWDDDFSAARNESLAHATKKWVLVLDCDERIGKEDCAILREAIENAPDEVLGFSLHQKSYLPAFEEGALKNEATDGTAGKHPFYSSHSLVRLFRNGLGLSFRHRVHELVEDSIREKEGRIITLPITIHHFGSAKGKDALQKKAQAYSALIQKQLEDEPDSARYNYQMARVFMSKGEWKDALLSFEKSSRIDPSYKDVFSEMAKIHLRLGNKEKAIECFLASNRLHPENLSSLNNLSVAYLSLGRFEEAKDVLEKALLKDPTNKAILHNHREAMKGITRQKEALGE